MSTIVATVAAFNLICTGTTFLGSGTDALKKENQFAYSETFRVDLHSGRWCSGNCATTSPIYSVDPTKIMLKLEEDKTMGWESFILLNREDGSILDRTKMGGELMAMSTGNCERAPFTGFPARRF